MNVSDLDLVDFSSRERRLLEARGWELERRGQAQRSVPGNDPLMLYKAKGDASNATRLVLTTPRDIVATTQVRAQTTNRANKEVAMLADFLQKHRIKKQVR